MSRRHVAATNRFVCTGEFLWKSLSLQQNLSRCFSYYNKPFLLVLSAYRLVNQVSVWLVSVFRVLIVLFSRLFQCLVNGSWIKIDILSAYSFLTYFWRKVLYYNAVEHRVGRGPRFPQLAWERECPKGNNLSSPRGLGESVLFYFHPYPCLLMHLIRQNYYCWLTELAYSTHFLLRDETLQLVFDLNQVMNIILGKFEVNVYKILWSEGTASKFSLAQYFYLRWKSASRYAYSIEVISGIITSRIITSIPDWTVKKGGVSFLS